MFGPLRFPAPHRPTILYPRLCKPARLSSRSQLSCTRLQRSTLQLGFDCGGVRVWVGGGGRGSFCRVVQRSALHDCWDCAATICGRLLQRSAVHHGWDGGGGSTIKKIYTACVSYCMRNVDLEPFKMICVPQWEADSGCNMRLLTYEGDYGSRLQVCHRGKGPVPPHPPNPRCSFEICSATCCSFVFPHTHPAFSTPLQHNPLQHPEHTAGGSARRRRRGGAAAAAQQSTPGSAHTAPTLSHMLQHISCSAASLFPELQRKVHDWDTF